MSNPKNITGIILAGGRSSRMGSEKGLVLFKEKPFIQHCIDALQPLVDQIFIVSNNTNYDTFEAIRIEDIIPDSGPIAGLHTGLSHTTTINNLVISCDVPMLTTSFLEKLLPYTNKDYDIVQFKAQEKTIPLIALYKKQCVDQCFKLLSSGEKRLRKLVTSLHTKTITVSKNEYVFVTNINTTTDLKTITNGVDY
ncbi:molybdenum cofactor guanylyltransferase [Aquimarina sp. I32.4]|uniref:molybdenum cofactor guanylyltransferase n=1 Tax=Aquimarina sp. I32.4 TaxID=2053903 RepID=UPI000CDE5E14|nr:molybdenum cofactor guanylyltransferase [Aquimarina sp. I32.4]